MTFDKQLELITPLILPNGLDFFDQQKKVIFTEGSANIIAGPGSGKTTVLIAKSALLIKQNTEINRGICLITHTNVAVDEIKMGLKKIGISNIEYPNFVGTIQDFFNTFFAKKAFHLVLKDKNFRVLDDDEYNKKFVELFEIYKPEKYSYSIPKFSSKNPQLQIFGDLSFRITSNAKPFYKEAFEKCLKILFERGIVTNYQCLELSKWYIEKYNISLKSAIKSRFKCFLLDEAQDTSFLQYELLNMLISDTDVSFQKFGDPYQALYNIFEGNNDAWVPIKETKETYQEISETSRFGSSIANIVKNICIERYDSFQSLNLVQSFAPYIIIYENEEDLFKQYKGLINICQKESESFDMSTKKDAILGAFHPDLEKLFSSYTRPSIKPNENENIIKKINNFMVNLISKELDIPFKELKQIIDSNLKCKVKLSICIKEFLKDEFLINEISVNLRDVLRMLTNDEKDQFIMSEIELQISNFKMFLNTKKNIQVSDDKIEFYIGTIHSVKGETHRSTLLVLDTRFTDYSTGSPIEFELLNLLRDYLAGEHISPTLIEDPIERNGTIMALKLAYVALSRPTHLAVVAIPTNLVSKDGEIIRKIRRNGWELFEQIDAQFV
ncbi:UvrD-helicase domain-containing protein [Lysinibacillus fusiformis]|uniref:UvrD-helicase domain-containing protein n=1 Tax=Lysinibacillus fusiformis TaxID=28031 RepID=UPI001244B413|nr:UvrD-helicase domain-containing protein [Lysinibacillus fusiformis]KAB0443984.1 hypothetical protein CH314_10310 [Lysinibacillus fusiformis]